MQARFTYVYIYTWIYFYKKPLHTTWQTPPPSTIEKTLTAKNINRNSKSLANTTCSYNTFELHHTMTDLTMTDLYHQKNNYSMAQHMFNDGRNRESMPMPENVHITKMDGRQLQAQTGCLVSLRLCSLAVENGLQAKLLDKFEEVIRENGMKEPTWEAMGKAIKAQVNPFELV